MSRQDFQETKILYMSAPPAECGPFEGPSPYPHLLVVTDWFKVSAEGNGSPQEVLP